MNLMKNLNSPRLLIVFAAGFFAAIAGIGNLLSADELAWAIRAGGEGNDKIRGICSAGDDTGGVFIIGEISDNADFGEHVFPGEGKLDFVLSKIDSNGNILWVKSAGGAGIDRGYAVSTDGKGGCYVTGHFDSESLSFDGVTMTSQGDYDGYLARFDAEGKTLWAFRFGGEGYDFGHGVSTDSDGNAIVSGTVSRPGGFLGEMLGDTKLRSAVVAKVSPEGNLIWSRVVKAPSISGHNVTVSQKDGTVYLCGFVRGEAMWSEETATTGKVQDVFLAKYSPDGEFQWVRTGGGESDGVATAVAVDDVNGHVCLAGMFKGTLRAGEKEFSSRGGHDFFTSIWNTEGDPVNAVSGGGEGTDYGLGATARSEGGFVVTGEITGTAKLAEKEYTSRGERDSYLLTLSGEGPDPVESFIQQGSVDNDLSYAVTETADGGIVHSGAFRNETKLGGKAFLSQKANDIFVAKWIRK